MCQHVWRCTDCSRVCHLCGLERWSLSLDRFATYSAPMHTGYDREARFKLKVDKLLGFHSGPGFADPVWNALDERRADMKCPRDVRRVLRGLDLKNKHYDCVKLFTTVFTPFRVTKLFDVLLLKQRLTRMFSDVLVKWNRFAHQQPFFSYDFLLRYFLEVLRSPLAVFVKPYTCKRRKKKYLAMLASILAGGGCRKSSRNSAAGRSPSG